jgi:hypothetical protein
MKTIIYLFLCVSFFFISCKDNTPITTDETLVVDTISVAKSNLVAYFPLEKGGFSSLAKGVGISWNFIGGSASFAIGKSGNGYKGDTLRSYLEYSLTTDNVISKIREFTFSTWYKVPTDTFKTEPMFSLNGGDDALGSLCVYENLVKKTDSLQLSMFLNGIISKTLNINGLSVKMKIPTDRWVFLCGLYKQSTSSIELYGNGKLLGSQICYDKNKYYQSATFQTLDSLSFGTDVTRLYLGACPKLINNVNDKSWYYCSGMIDELRIYNSPLTQAQIQSLYNAELSKANKNP